jgi:membrane protease YdiL (CAAX protease family)
VIWAVPIGVATLALAALIAVNEKYVIFSSDRFPTTAARFSAYGWLAVFVLLLTVLVAGASQAPVEAADIQNLSFWSLFTLHIVLLVFLAGWWALAGRPRISEFMNIQPGNRFRAVMLGIAIGVGGWAVTIALAMAVALILSNLDLLPKDLKPSPVIPWMAALPIWQKLVIIFSAMTVEEAFFRGWLQKRVGLVLSTLAFVIAHAGYGQPFMMIGIGIVSIVIGLTFYRTKNLIPCIVAHGVFDAIQLLILVPLAVKFAGLG